MRIELVAAFLLVSSWPATSFAQCAPAPDSPYFFRNLSQQRAEAKIADDRKFYEELLSDAFEIKARDGKATPKSEFIDAELAAARVSQQRRFFAIRNFSLVEHQRDFVVADYLLIEGTTGGGETHATEAWVREVYKVEDGKWRLTTIEPAPAQSAQNTN